MISVGIYARYSNVDVLVGDESESRSIKNQIEILSKYAHEHNMIIYKAYSDHHESGTKMDRPALQELLKDASEGKINTILVKDLSRFGRNYMEVGNYVNNIFPSFGIRFIAVNDNYDSADTYDELALALKNYINHLYAKDASKKIRKSMLLRAETEPLLTWKYGYDIKNKKITIDPISSEYVKEVFKLAREGNVPYRIAKIMNERGIPSPGKYKSIKCNSKSCVDTLWTAGAASKIIRDETYTGKFTNFASTNKGSKREPDNANATVVSIPQIITEEEFNNTPKYYRDEDKDYEIKKNRLPSMIRCMDCVNEMTKRKHDIRWSFMVPKEENGKVIYLCNRCRKKLEAEKIEKRIYKELLLDIDKINSNREDYIKKLGKELGAIEKVRLDTNEVHLKMKSLFEDYLKGKISFKDYQNKQNMLAADLIYGGYSKKLKDTPITFYNLRNRVIRYLNSLNIDKTEHNKFIRDNIIEVDYSISSKKIKFIYPFMKG